jgi:hypothetical protein
MCISADGEFCIIKKPVIEDTSIPVPHCHSTYPAQPLVGRYLTIIHLLAQSVIGRYHSPPFHLPSTACRWQVPNYHSPTSTVFNRSVMDGWWSGWERFRLMITYISGSRGMEPQWPLCHQQEPEAWSLSLFKQIAAEGGQSERKCTLSLAKPTSYSCPGSSPIASWSSTSEMRIRTLVLVLTAGGRGTAALHYHMPQSPLWLRCNSPGTPSRNPGGG